MRNPAQLWRAVEEIPGLKAVRDEWRRWLGDDCGWIEQNLLRPTGELATVYPSKRGEPYQIVGHGGGRYRAVHPDGDPPLDLVKANIAILRLDVVRLARLLCGAFGFRAGASIQAHAIGRYRIGTWSVTARTTCPVWFCVQPDQSLLHDLLRYLAADAEGPFVVLTPGPIGDASLVRTLTDRIACHVPLSEALESIDGGSLAVSAAGARIIGAFRRLVRRAEAADEAGEPCEWRCASGVETLGTPGMPPAPAGSATPRSGTPPRGVIEGSARQPEVPPSNRPVLDEDAMTVSYMGISCQFPPRRSLLFGLLKRIIRQPGRRVGFDVLCQKDAPWDGRTVDDSTIRGAVSRLRRHLRAGGLDRVASAISTMNDTSRGYVLFDPTKLDSTDDSTQT